MGSVIALRTPWQLAAEASDRIAELMTDIPGWSRYRYSPETQSELQRAAVLLHVVIPLLERARDREEAAHGEV